MNKKKIVKIALISFIAIVALVLLLIIYKNLFKNTDSSRYKNIENYELTNEEIKNVKGVFDDIDEIKDISVYVNSKIIKIFIKLNSDVDFDKIKTKADDSLKEISEDNLSYYDVEIFIESESKDSEVYPKIGYKHKTRESFEW